MLQTIFFHIRYSWLWVFVIGFYDEWFLFFSLLLRPSLENYGCSIQFVIAKPWKQTKSQSAEEWVKTITFAQLSVTQPQVDKSEAFVDTQMQPETVVSEINETHMCKHSVVSLVCESERVNKYLNCIISTVKMNEFAQWEGKSGIKEGIKEGMEKIYLCMYVR